MNKILIIEDSIDDYRKLVSILDNYNVTYYPGEKEFKEFSGLLAEYASLQDEATLAKIKAITDNIDPDYILLDIGLDYNKSVYDSTGLELRLKLFDKDFNKANVFLISGKSGEATKERKYIYKKAHGGLEAELYQKFFLVKQIEPITSNNPPEPPAKSGPQKNEKDEIAPAKVENPLKAATSEPESLEKFRRWATFKLKPWIQFGIDIVISYLFYILLLSLAVAGPVLIVKAAVEAQFQLLVIAENTFIAFLPLLVVFGFYIFYIQSLQPYIMDAKVADNDFDKASKLMMLTKKLFVSSLISYLFTKLIELLYLDVPRDSTSAVPVNWFELYHVTATPLAQMYATAATILVLILYYLYLHKHESFSRTS